MKLNQYKFLKEQIRTLSRLDPEEAQRKLKAISLVIPKFITCEAGKRIRRGTLQELIFKTLRLRKTNANIYLLKSVLVAQGFEEILIQGKRYYAGPPGPKKSRKRKSYFQSFSQNSEDFLASTDPA